MNDWAYGYLSSAIDRLKPGERLFIPASYNKAATYYNLRLFPRRFSFSTCGAPKGRAFIIRTN